MEFNPWNVSSLEDFHFYNCPECELKYASKEQFIGHAVLKHPKAHEFIPTFTQSSEPMKSDPLTTQEVHFDHDIKTEPIEPFSETEPDVHWDLTDNYEPIPNDDVKQEILEDQVVIEPQPKKTKNYRGIVNENMQYNCDQCGKIFSKKSNLNRHIQSVHENVQYKCKKCDKSYSDKSHLNAHIKSIHENIRFPCNQCGKVLHSQGGLAAHKKSQHPNENAKFYYCDFCTYTTNIKGNFIAHCKRRHTSMLIYDQDPRS